MPSNFLEQEKVPVLEFADVAKLVDALDLGSSAARHGGSSPSIRTEEEPSFRDQNPILIGEGASERVFIL